MTDHDLPEVPATPIETAPKPWVNRDGNHTILTGQLTAAGVELGAYDQRIADWLAGWETATVLTIASWIRRASDLEILRTRIAELEKDSATLAALEAAGVDNWDGYSDAVAGESDE